MKLDVLTFTRCLTKYLKSKHTDIHNMIERRIDSLIVWYFFNYTNFNNNVADGVGVVMTNMKTFWVERCKIRTNGC